MHRFITISLAIFLLGCQSVGVDQTDPDAKAFFEGRGVAEMNEDRSIVLLLRLELGDALGEKRVEYRPDHPEYENVLEYVGPIEPGQWKFISTTDSGEASVGNSR